VNFNDPTGHAADQPPQQENKQDEQPGPTQPATSNQAAMKKQEEKMVDQPKKVGDEIKQENLSIINAVTAKSGIEKEEIRSDSSGSGEYMASRTTVSSGKHEAIDIKAEVGTDLVAPVSGKVIDNPYVKKELAGVNLSIETATDKGTRIVVSMSHLQEKSVKEGDIVKQGDIVAKAGASGNAGKTSPHVHFSIRYGAGRGVSLNPVEVLKNQGF
jgi:murein DD-endopeptidase MepM/ murein hydrolase activator NlpD